MSLYTEQTNAIIKRESQNGLHYMLREDNKQKPNNRM